MATLRSGPVDLCDQILLVQRWRSSGLARIAHTGYTGEAGFEIYVPPAEASHWHRVMDAGGNSASSPAARRPQHARLRPRWRSPAMIDASHAA